MDVQLFKQPKQRWANEADDVITVEDDAEFVPTVKDVAEKHLPAVTAAIYDEASDSWQWTPKRDAPEVVGECEALILGCPPYHELHRHARSTIETGSFMTSNDRADELIENWNDLVQAIDEDVLDPDMLRALYETLSELITYDIQPMDEAGQDEYDELEHLTGLMDLFVIDREGGLPHDRRDNQLL